MSARTLSLAKLIALLACADRRVVSYTCRPDGQWSDQIDRPMTQLVQRLINEGLVTPGPVVGHGPHERRHALVTAAGFLEITRAAGTGGTTADRPGFFEPGTVYLLGDPADDPDLLEVFRCEAVGRHPVSRELRAFGFVSHAAPGDDWMTVTLIAADWDRGWRERPPYEQWWLPIETAPRDGTEIVGRIGGGPLEIRWAEERICMLAFVEPGLGRFDEGWEDVENGLVIFDDMAPDAWRPAATAAAPVHDAAAV